MQEPIIRPAEERDIPRVGELLREVNEVHHTIRPDLFKTGARKYNDAELRAVLRNPDAPVFVYEADGKVYGYAFCKILKNLRNDGNLVPITSLYLDDLCVDEGARGRGIGTSLYRFVLGYAKENGCHNLTLNVWEGNAAALAFYRKCGMKVQRTCMETVLE